MKKKCIICGTKITIMIMRGTGVCGERCRKIRDGENPNEFESRLPG